MDPSLYKTLKTARGYTYRYICVTAIPTKPTLLFLHGFPSTAYDWHNQIDYFSTKGYGLIVPDMLGYGGTDKPTDVQAFRMTAMTKDVIEILDAERVEKAVAVGHDMGSVLVSRLSSNQPGRFLGFAFLAVSYSPGMLKNIEAVIEKLQEELGNPCFGYWLYFKQEGAAREIEKNMDSFLSMVHPKDPVLWFTDMAPLDYLTEEEYVALRKTLLEGGLTAPLNWYKIYFTDYNEDVWNHFISKPAFFGAALKDYVCLAELGRARMMEFAKGGMTLVEFDTGHWIQFEQPEKLNRELEKWVDELTSQ